MPDPIADPGSTTVPPAAWHAGLDADVLGHVQARGWDALPADKAVLEAVKGHLSATQMLGVPADQIVRLPKDPNDVDGWKQVHQRLGAPSDPKDYDFTPVKFKDGTPLDEKFTDFMRGKLVGLGVSKTAAVGVAQSFAEFLDQTTDADAAEAQEKITASKAALATLWGPNTEANQFVAKQAAAAVQQAMGEKLGPRLAAAIDAMAGTEHYDVIQEMFRQIGTKIGEDRFVAGGAGGNQPMTKESALVQITELKKDDAFVAKLMAGGSEENKRWKGLHVMAYGDDTAQSRSVGR